MDELGEYVWSHFKGTDVKWGYGDEADVLALVNEAKKRKVDLVDLLCPEDETSTSGRGKLTVEGKSVPKNPKGLH